MRIVLDLGVREVGIDKRYNKPYRRRYVLAACPECGDEKEMSLTKASRTTCCINCRGLKNVTHGMSGKPVYYVWQQMRDRCSNPKNPKYHIYGGKGVTVCDEWQTFEGFWKDMEEGYYKGMTIDRINSNQGYNKGNCQWISHSRNSAKTSKVRPVTQYHIAQKPERILLELKQWPSALSAAQNLGLTAACITMVCQGKNKSHGGYGWKYTGE